MDQMNLAAAGPALGSNASYIEKLYARWKESPGAVAEAWQTYFTQLETGAVPDSGVIARAGAEARPSCIPENEVLAFAQRQVAVQQLVAAYRNLGAEISDLDPLKNQPARVIPELDPSYYGLTDADLDQVFSTANTYFGRASMTLRELIEALRETYCGKIGAEFMYITDPEEKRWWQQRLESIRSAPSLTPEAKVHILERLTASEGLEHFLHKRYTGQKRFSLEGGESFIVAMDRIVEDAASRGMKEIVIGMAHRGRLNVLVNIQNKDLQALYDEFDGKESAESLPSGDVKYHNGFENSVPTASGPIWVSMEFNPSHLEAADPVALGSVRAREDQLGDREGNQVLGILVHGDAAFSGQGIVQETLNLASTRGFGTGGTVHIVINNQIGFTTSDPRDKGSMLYCTDPAKVTETPVLHVNGDEPESVALATQIAMECRLRFHRDVVLDIVCYRRLGHNEQDTPAVTQPLMYKKIDVHPTVRELYGKALEENGTIPEGRAQEMDRYVRDRLKKSENPRVIPESLRAKHVVDWSPWIGKARTEPATSVPVAKLTELGRAITAVPAAFRLHPLVIRVLDSRRQMAEGAAPVDWGMAEHLAFASL
jgi:2-oxoglutarate dehydrogenase E1 component